MWGHDFRPEYRALGRLKEARPGLALHAYTATATQRVRADVIDALKLENPRVLIGSFDRPNLVYRAARRGAILTQVEQVIKKRPGQSGIVYCIRRADADRMAAYLTGRGYRALPYHAGLSDLERKKNQEAFIREDADVIVATVAFGMGIDKSNVRYVIHAGMPKSLEHYQQESGRAGRDGLEAECLLFYSGGDFVIWRNVIEESEPSTAEVGLSKLGEIYRYCTGVTCRHQALVGYFGRQLPASGSDGCGACDVCLGGLDRQDDALVIAQKILSCVLRLKECFGGDYTAQVLVGSKDARIEGNRHNELSTYGLLSEYPKTVVRDWMEQLCAQGYLTKTSEYNLLKVTPEGRQVLRGQTEPTLLKPAKRTRAEEARKRKEKRPVGSGDPALFEKLRQLRREIAREKDVAAFIVFGDRTLEDMAARKPKTIEELMEVHGVGRLKAEEYGERFLKSIRGYGG
jgi:ATP-dependent DNA helicase RecQ